MLADLQRQSSKKPRTWRGCIFVVLRIPCCVRGDYKLSFGQLGRLDHHETAAGTAVHKLDHAADFGEESVVFAAADVGAGLDARAALPHDDGPAGDKLSAESFDAQPLRIRVAAVSGTS